MARGPAYPFIGLEQAVDLTRQLYDYSKRSPANLEAVLKEKWDYSPTSSSAVKIVAALKYYGLVETAPSEKGETIKITDRAYRILVDNAESPEWRQALRDAFLAPKAYKLCWDKWGSDLPQSMRSTLIFAEGFVETTVDAFLNNYKKSLHFAGMDNDLDVKRPATPEVPGDGDLKREELQSTQPIKPPATTQAVAAVSGSAAVRPLAEMPPPLKGVGMRQEVFALAEGDVTIQWPEQLSPDSFQDFTDWLKLLERRIKRSVQAPAPAPRVDSANGNKADEDQEL